DLANGIRNKCEGDHQNADQGAVSKAVQIENPIHVHGLQPMATAIDEHIKDAVSPRGKGDLYDDDRDNDRPQGRGDEHWSGCLCSHALPAAMEKVSRRQRECAGTEWTWVRSQIRLHG